MRAAAAAAFLCLLWWTPGPLLQGQTAATPPEKPAAPQPPAAPATAEAHAAAVVPAAPPEGAAPAPVPLPEVVEGSPESMPEAPPAGEPVKPMSDAEETGALKDLLPDFVDPLTLPVDQGPSPGSLFPPEIWAPPPGEWPEEPVVASLSGADQAGGVLSPEVVASCFGDTPPPALHDPQGLLAPAEAYELRKLLERTLMGRGGFRFSLVLLGGGQQVPANVDFHALLDRWYGSEKGVLVVYYAGHPERTLGWFSKPARTAHREEDLRMVLDLGMKEAARPSYALQQLQRFCIKTAIRLDRLHRQGDVSPSDELPGMAAAVKAPAPASSTWWWAVIIGLQAAALAAAAAWWLRRRQRARRGDEIILLPPQEVAARLGGAHSGGSGALLAFGANAPARRQARL